MKNFFIVLLFFASLVTQAQRTYHVTLRFPSGNEELFDCPDDVTILDRARALGLSLNCSDYAGASSTCASRLIWGFIDQSEQSFLDDSQLDAGWVLICSAYPRSDCTLEVMLEQQLLNETGDIPKTPELCYGQVRADNGGSATVAFDARYKVDLDLYNNSFTFAQTEVSVNSPYAVSSRLTGENKTWASLMLPLTSYSNSYTEQLSYSNVTHWNFSISCSADNANINFCFTNPFAY